MLAPAADLAVKIVAGLAVTGEAPVREFDRVQGRDHAVHLFVDRAAFLCTHARQGLVPQYAPGHEFHDVEGPANDGFIFTQAEHAGHRHIRALQATHDRKLTLNRVGRGQQLGHRARLGAHHIAL